MPTRLHHRYCKASNTYKMFCVQLVACSLLARLFVSWVVVGSSSSPRCVALCDGRSTAAGTGRPIISMLARLFCNRIR